MLRRTRARRVVMATVVAGMASGLPSTLHAVATGRDPLEATRAAGTILLPNETRSARLVIAAIPVHAALSFGWAALLARVLPERRKAFWGGVAGMVIAALDLSLARRWWPRVAALPQLPQVADHVAFGALVGGVLSSSAEPR